MKKASLYQFITFEPCLYYEHLGIIIISSIYY